MTERLLLSERADSVAFSSGKDSDALGKSQNGSEQIGRPQQHIRAPQDTAVTEPIAAGVSVPDRDR